MAEFSPLLLSLKGIPVPVATPDCLLYISYKLIRALVFFIRDRFHVGLWSMTVAVACFSGSARWMMAGPARLLCQSTQRVCESVCVCVCEGLQCLVAVVLSPEQGSSGALSESSRASLARIDPL